MEIKINSRFNLGSEVYVVASNLSSECSECGNVTTGNKVISGTIGTIDYSYLHTVDSKPYRRVIYIINTEYGDFVRKGDEIFKSRSKAEAFANA